VARIDEGLALRRAGIAAPILIFGPTPAGRAAELRDHHLVPTLLGLDHGRELSAAARNFDAPLPVHIKVDTGMGRLGLACDDLRPPGTGSAVEEILGIMALPGLKVQGIFTHFATSDHADLSYAREQLRRFTELKTRIEAAGRAGLIWHAANSGAIMGMAESHLSMVRAGISVYGLYPSAQVDRTRLGLHPALSLKATIVNLKQVAAGTPISYGCTYRAPAATTIATPSAPLTISIQRPDLGKARAKAASSQKSTPMPAA
jgi:alanine racemase